MNLIFDIGNSQYKISIFEKDTMLENNYLREICYEKLNLLIKKHSIKKVIFCDTRSVDIEKIKTKLPEDLFFLNLTHTTPLPIKINYQTPKTLGKDRIAAAVGAYHLFPSRNNLIIDIGTAITIDFLSEENIFEGGVISPGQELRFRALHEFTGKLPLEKPSKEEILSPKTTSKAIQQGVQNGIVFEINEYIRRYKEKYENLNVIITGGYAYLFEKRINYPIFAELFLVSIGLNKILNNNTLI